MTARSMLARMPAQALMRGVCSPATTRALNSAQAPTDSRLHCTLVCWGLNLATSAKAPHRSHSTGRRAGGGVPAGREVLAVGHAQPAPACRAARLAATSVSHSATALVVSTSNSYRATMAGLMSSTSV